MCGISGFWAPNVGREIATKMALAIAHRGPDGEGLWADPKVGISLAHRRLAIIDLSPAGLQPMLSATGRYVISFNGEVYNFAAIRAELERQELAPSWRGGSDTEVMLAAIEAWGLEPALARFIGMFAFALYDTTERLLHLVRDRLGVKPLYLATTAKGFAFASELKALRLFPGFDATVDQEAMVGYLATYCVPGERSIFRGARRVAPGTFLTFCSHDAAPKLTRYWDPRQVVTEGLTNPFQGTEEEALDELDALLRDAVKLRMVADVPLGAFLSGGIDSSMVVALMQAESARPVHTFSIANETSAFDESPAARRIARHLNTHHTPFTVTAKDALDVIPLLPGMYDEPFADSSQIPTYLVAKLARASVTVAVSGDGGDELFGGYVRHIWAQRIRALQRYVPSWVLFRLGSAIASRRPAVWDDLFRRTGGGVSETRIGGIRMRKLATILGVADPRRIYELLTSHWLPEDGILLQSVPLPPPSLDPPEVLRDDLTGAMMFRDLTSYLPDDILTKVDRATMAVSLEGREPLLDHRLVAFAWRLPQSMKIRGNRGKWILRRLLQRYVPLELVAGPKAGFGVPMGDWLRGPLRDWAESLLSRERLVDGAVFEPTIVRQRWKEHLEGTHPWEHHMWDVLMFQAWRESARV